MNTYLNILLQGTAHTAIDTASLMLATAVPAADSSSLISNLLIVLVGLVVIFSMVLSAYLFLRNSRKRRIQADIDDIGAVWRENVRRVTLIETHAIDYFNSMAPDAREAFALAKQIINAVEDLIESLECLIALGDNRSLTEAEALLAQNLQMKSSAVTMVEGLPDIPLLYRHQWEGTLDHLFQTVGKEISRASENAYSFNMTRRERRRTIENLIDAGIHFVSEKGRRLTSSFRRLDLEEEEHSRPNSQP